jgi:hypothetical protein
VVVLAGGEVVVVAGARVEGMVKTSRARRII